ncbi:MAG: ATP-dependent helicase RecG [Hyphomicrobiales bacterium]|jgi:ATP-dependent DNA helicase RecG|nr:ATP-dependent helicase RecG [Hyphomicrobiales bacterium]
MATIGIEVIQITGAQRDRLMVLEEGHFCDLKAIAVSTKKLGRSVSAFANAAGGELYIGIGETKLFGSKVRTWHGFRDQEAANGHIQSLEALFPLGAEYSYEFLSCPGSTGLVLHITVQRTPQIARAHNKKVFVRRGAQNLEVKGAEALRRLELDKGIVSYEKQPVSADLSILTESDNLAAFIKQVVPMQTPPVFVRKQVLSRNNQPIVAGVLLFAEEPQALLPKSGVKLFRYKTTAEVGTRETLAGDPEAIEGTTYEVISQAVAKTVAMVEGIQRLGPEGFEPVVYPDEALHEIVTNAILHRDYSIASDVQIRVFENRIEVESPGRLPGHVTTRNILKTQFSRNGVLVRLIHKFPNPPNKDVGEGLNTAFDAMKQSRLKPPVIRETENSVLVEIRHDKLATAEESVMDFLGNHPEITNRTARELTGISSENTMKDVFLRLAKRNLIERVPGRKGASSAWQKYSG